MIGRSDTWKRIENLSFGVNKKRRVWQGRNRSWRRGRDHGTKIKTYTLTGKEFWRHPLRSLGRIPFLYNEPVIFATMTVRSRRWRKYQTESTSLTRRMKRCYRVWLTRTTPIVSGDAPLSLSGTRKSQEKPHFPTNTSDLVVSLQERRNWSKVLEGKCPQLGIFYNKFGLR